MFEQLEISTSDFLKFQGLIVLNFKSLSILKFQGLVVLKFQVKIAKRVTATFTFCRQGEKWVVVRVEHTISSPGTLLPYLIPSGTH
jgi:hypothetical protein